jgi:histone H3/H4
MFIGGVMYISETAIKRMLKDAGAERISKEAIREFRKHVDKTAFASARKAVRLAHHAKRKTVDISDVRLATD